MPEIPGKAVYMTRIPKVTTYRWLVNGGNKGRRLPCAPLDMVERSTSPNVQTIQLARGGQVTFAQGRSLVEVNFQSVFPMFEMQGAARSRRPGALFPNAPQSVNDIRRLPDGSIARNGYLMPTWAFQPTNQYQYESPDQMGVHMMNIAKTAQVFQLLIADPSAWGAPLGGDSVFVNMPAVMTDYRDWIDDGDVRWYSVSFREHRQATIRKVKKRSKKKKPRPRRTGKKPTRSTAKTSRSSRTRSSDKRA